MVARKTETLVSSDSVLRPLQGCPRKWQVRIYPGARFSDLDHLLGTLGPRRSENLQRIVIYAGVNHNRDSNLDYVRSQVRSIVERGYSLKIKIYFFLISTPLTMTRELKDRLADINEVIRHASDGFFIPPLPPYLVRQTGRDPSGVHYDAETAQWIIRSMFVHLEDFDDIASGRAAARL